MCCGHLIYYYFYPLHLVSINWHEDTVFWGIQLSR
jgi:hypothetical protein